MSRRLQIGPVPAAPSPYKPVPGPADRVTFFTMQRRHRRASWRFSALAIAAVVLTGLPLSIIITPLLYAIVLLVSAGANAIHPGAIPPRFWDVAQTLPAIVPHTMALLGGKSQQVPLREMFVVGGLLVAPGALLLLAFWTMIRVVFHRAGVGGVLLTLGARDPDLNDFEERQLMNLVEEMAIAAGVPPPRVMLIDRGAADGAANAAAVGWSIDDATVVVTRPLLDSLERDETQAVMGRLIGAIGNGDLKIALIILSIYQAVGVVSLLLNAVFGFRAWRTLLRFFRLALWPHQAAEQDAVMSALARAASEDRDVEAFTARQHRGGCLSVLALPLVPIELSAMSINVIVSMSTSLFVGQLIGAMWRRRQLLADATAVQLTRNPDGLATALERLGRMPVAVPKAAPVAHLFATWSGPADDSVSRYMLVKTDQRLAKLRQMGARINLTSRKTSLLGRVLVLLFVAPFVVLTAVAMAAAFVVMMGLDLLFMLVLLAALAALAHAAAVYGPRLPAMLHALARRFVR